MGAKCGLKAQSQTSPYPLPLHYRVSLQNQVTLAAVEALLIKGEGVNTLVRFGTPSPFSNGNRKRSAWCSIDIFRLQRLVLRSITCWRMQLRDLPKVQT